MGQCFLLLIQPILNYCVQTINLPVSRELIPKKVSIHRLGTNKYIQMYCKKFRNCHMYSEIHYFERKVAKYHDRLKCFPILTSQNLFLINVIILGGFKQFHNSIETSCMVFVKYNRNNLNGLCNLGVNHLLHCLQNSSNL